jgi:predicted lipid-binding transport protein (Tim44 family)
MSQKNAPIMPAGYHIGLNIALNIFVGGYYLYMAIDNFNRGIYGNPYYDPTTIGGAMGSIMPILFWGILLPLIIAFIAKLFKPALFLKTLIIAMYIMQVFLLIGLKGSVSRNNRLYNSEYHQQQQDLTIPSKADEVICFNHTFLA